jgi:hypothetical protein
MTRSYKALVGAVLLAIPVGVAVWIWPSRRIQEPPRLRAPQTLSATARDALRGQMHEHGATMQTLVWDVVLLEYGRTAETARQIAGAQTIARALTTDATELNAQLPPQFFTFQDQLKERAAALAEVAAKRDAALLSDKFNAVMETCMGCHGAYLQEPH